MGEADDAAGDLRAAGLLLALYTLQGIPMGLSGAVPLLLAGRASYASRTYQPSASLSTITRSETACTVSAAQASAASSSVGCGPSTRSPYSPGSADGSQITVGVAAPGACKVS